MNWTEKVGRERIGWTWITSMNKTFFLITEFWICLKFHPKRNSAQTSQVGARQQKCFNFELAKTQNQYLIWFSLSLNVSPPTLVTQSSHPHRKIIFKSLNHKDIKRLKTIITVTSKCAFCMWMIVIWHRAAGCLTDAMDSAGGHISAEPSFCSAFH